MDRGVGGAAALVLIFSIVAYYLDMVYSYSFKSIVETMFSDEYSYVLVVIGMILLITLFKYRFIHLSFDIDPGRLLLATTLLILSFTILILSNLLDLYIPQFKGLSIILLLWASATYILDRESIKRLSYPFAALLFAVPLPREVIDPLSSSLSIYTAQLSSLLTGAELRIDERLQAYIVTIMDNTGYPRSFNIAPICSGYISIMNILALSIIVFYFAWNSRLGLGRRILYIILLLGLGIIIVYLGNLLRVSLVLWVTRWFGYDMALAFFHQAPSLIYSSFGALIIIILSLKIFGWTGQKPPNPVMNGGRHVYRRPNQLVIILIIILGLSLVMNYSYPSVSAYKLLGNRGNYYTTLDSLLKNTSSTLFSRLDAKVVYVRDEPALAEVLGASIVKRFGIEVNGTRYDGYIEVAESPGRYHSWSVCLVVQGCKIFDSWSVNMEDGTYTFYKFSRDIVNMLMGLSIYSVPVYIGGVKTTAYIRVSIIKYGWGGEEDILNILRAMRLGEVREGLDPLVTWVDASLVMIGFSLAYVFLSIFIRYRRILHRLFPVVR